jgi:hypothetical protein
MNLVALPSQTAQDAATCPNCSAALVADQRYCLSCGQPCSPVRLPFLDLLREEEGAQAQTVLPPPAGYAPVYEPDGALGWLRRYSGLLALVAVLLATGLIGLLIGHWIKSPAPSGAQVVKVELPNGLPLAAASGAAGATSPSATATTSSSATPAPASEAQEKKEVKETEATTVKAPPPVKKSSASLTKLSKTTGKAHRKEIESLTAGGKPIETGG